MTYRKLGLFIGFVVGISIAITIVAYSGIGHFGSMVIGIMCSFCFTNLGEEIGEGMDEKRRR